MKYSRVVVLALCVVAQNEAHAQDFAERMAQGAFEKLLAESTAPQSRATMNTFLGRADLNAEISGIPRESMDCPVGDAVQVDGTAWVLEHAESRKILMFNENHYGLQARTFVYELLPQLRELGFTHMGFEVFQPGAKKGGRISPAAGYYSVEPVFAALVRLAADLGFEVFDYESADKAPQGASVAESVRIRELAQARNIQGVIESAPTDARFIVFAGWSHIAEIALAGWGEKTRWMAANLKESTGIDPLTIDLSGCAYASRNNHDWRGRAFLSENDVPVVSGQYSGAVDAQIHLPMPVAGDASAAGYFRKSLGAAFPVPEMLIPSEEAILVQAYKLGEKPDGVAVDRVLLRPGENLPLYLPPGKYELIGHRGSGEVVNRIVVAVAGEVAASEDERQAVLATLDSWNEGWRLKDAELAVADYSEDVDWTNAFGDRFQGKDALRKGLEFIFGLAFVMAGESEGNVYADVTFLAPDIALIRSELVRVGQETDSGETMRNRHVHHLRVLQKRDGQWVIVSHLISQAKEKGSL